MCFVIFSCVTCTVSEDGIYAKYIVARVITITPSDIIKMDVLEALFSDKVDPCMEESKYKVSSITCNSYTLSWDESLNHYKYSKITTFLLPGTTYTFNTEAGTSVPAHTASIVFPSVEPIITEPVYGASCNRSGNLSIKWRGISSDSINILLLSTTDYTKYISTDTTNKGGHRFFPLNSLR